MTRNFLVAAFYRFAALPDFAELRAPLLEKALALDVIGSILLAPEGINGTIAGSTEGVQALLDHLRSDPRLAGLEHKESWAEVAPFKRMKVKLKREIVTLGLPEVNPVEMAGTYVPPQDWNALISDPDVIVIDTRNDYEVKVGTFKGAVNPGTRSFREFPEWLKRTRLDTKVRVAMYCTGGIRCEKSTALLKSMGFENVFHLQGGILKYLETVPEEQSLWEGECYVFDERVSVKHGLAPGSWSSCHACGMPVQRKDMESTFDVEGASCSHCCREVPDSEISGQA